MHIAIIRLDQWLGVELENIDLLRKFSFSRATYASATSALRTVGVQTSISKSVDIPILAPSMSSKLRRSFAPANAYVLTPPVRSDQTALHHRRAAAAHTASPNAVLECILRRVRRAFRFSPTQYML